MPWTIIGLYVLCKLMFVTIGVAIAGIALLVQLIRHICSGKPATLPANTRQLPKRTDTPLAVYKSKSQPIPARDTPSRKFSWQLTESVPAENTEEQRPYRKLKWEKLIDNTAVSDAPKPSRKLRRRTTL